MFFEYAKRNLALIPAAKNSKRPIINNWQKYSTELPSELDLDLWSKDFKDFNCGLVLGPASGLIALDIDTDNIETLSLCPKSPIVKRGKKGETRFFKYTSVKTTRLHDKGIEILSNGSFTVLPPSIHPDGMNYEWISKDTLLSFDLDMLPPLDTSFVNLLPIIKDTKNITIGVGGRNNKLKEIASASCYNGESLEDTAQAVYLFDKDNHEKRLFNDLSEGFKASDEDQAYSNAMVFCINIFKSIHQSDTAINIKKKSSDITIDISDIVAPKLESFKPYPKPRGIMKAFVDICEKTSQGSQDALGLGGALALISGVCANRFKTRLLNYDVRSNIYIINLGYSGYGKETPQGLIQYLLQDSDLIGSGNYKSGSSIIMNLPQQQERVDIIDECSMFLKSMASKEDYKSEIVDVMSSLYSKSDSYFLGYSSRGDGKNFGACYNPSVTLLGSTTPSGFSKNISKEMAAKGLLPRFTVFFQKDVGEYKGLSYESLVEEKKFLKDIIESIIKNHPKIEYSGFDNKIDFNRKSNADGDPMSVGKLYLPKEIPLSKAASDLLIDYDKSYHYKGAVDPDSFESAFYKRFAQNACKFALLDCVSLCEGYEEISLDSARWAIDVIETQWKNIRPLYELGTAENNIEKNELKVFNIVKENGVISRRDLLRKLRSFNKSEKIDYINSLIDQEKILRVKIKGRKKERDAYKLAVDLIDYE